MSTSASFAETARFTYEAIDALVPTLEEQQARAASSSPSTTASSPESEEECRALEAEFLVDLDDDSDASPSTSAGSLGEQSSGPPTAPASATATTTPDCYNSPPESRFALSPLALNDDLAPAAPEPVAQSPSALDVECSATTAPDAEQALSASPRSAFNAQVLSALLEVIGDGGGGEHTTGTSNLGYHTTPPSLGFETSPLSPVPDPPAVDIAEELATPETVAQYPAALSVDSSGTTAADFEQAPFTYPTSVEQTAPTHDLGQPAYTQQDGQSIDPSLAHAHGLNPHLVQPQLYYGPPQGYSTVPPAPYHPMGMPPSNYYGPPVPQPPYQYGYYHNNYNYYVPNGSDGSGLDAGLPQFSMPGFPMHPPFEQPSASLSSSKPLSASARPNEPAKLAEGEAASASSKRKRAAAGGKGKGKAKEVEENVEQGNSATFSEERADEEGAPPPKKARRPTKASQAAAGSTEPARKNRTYTQVGDNKFQCSHCGRNDLTKAATKKHAEMCGRAERSRTCSLCGTVITSGRNSSLERHMKTPLCKRMRASYAQQLAANQPGPIGISSMVGTQFTFAYDAAARGTQGENGLSAEVGYDDDLDGNVNDENSEHDVYADVAGPSSVTLEDIPKPKNQATQEKATKKNLHLK